jgi:hypothetical protein
MSEEDHTQQSTPEDAFVGADDFFGRPEDASAEFARMEIADVNEYGALTSESIDVGLAQLLDGIEAMAYTRRRNALKRTLERTIVIESKKPPKHVIPIVDMQVIQHDDDRATAAYLSKRASATTASTDAEREARLRALGRSLELPVGARTETVESDVHALLKSAIDQKDVASLRSYVVRILAGDQAAVAGYAYVPKPDAKLSELGAGRWPTDNLASTVPESLIPSPTRVAEILLSLAPFVTSFEDYDTLLDLAVGDRAMDTSVLQTLKTKFSERAAASRQQSSADAVRPHAKKTRTRVSRGALIEAVDDSTYQAALRSRVTKLEKTIRNVSEFEAAARAEVDKRDGKDSCKRIRPVKTYASVEAVRHDDFRSDVRVDDATKRAVRQGDYAVVIPGGRLFVRVQTSDGSLWVSSGRIPEDACAPSFGDVAAISDAVGGCVPYGQACVSIAQARLAMLTEARETLEALLKELKSDSQSDDLGSDVLQTRHFHVLTRSDAIGGPDVAKKQDFANDEDHVDVLVVEDAYAFRPIAQANEAVADHDPVASVSLALGFVLADHEIGAARRRANYFERTAIATRLERFDKLFAQAIDATRYKSDPKYRAYADQQRRLRTDALRSVLKLTLEATLAVEQVACRSDGAIALMSACGADARSSGDETMLWDWVASVLETGNVGGATAANAQAVKQELGKWWAIVGSSRKETGDAWKEFIKYLATGAVKATVVAEHEPWPSYRPNAYFAHGAASGDVDFVRKLLGATRERRSAVARRTPSAPLSADVGLEFYSGLGVAEVAKQTSKKRSRSSLALKYQAFAWADTHQEVVASTHAALQQHPQEVDVTELGTSLPSDAVDCIKAYANENAWIAGDENVRRVLSLKDSRAWDVMLSTTTAMWERAAATMVGIMPTSKSLMKEIYSTVFAPAAAKDYDEIALKTMYDYLFNDLSTLVARAAHGKKTSVRVSGAGRGEKDVMIDLDAASPMKLPAIASALSGSADLGPMWRHGIDALHVFGATKADAIRICIVLAYVIAKSVSELLTMFSGDYGKQRAMAALLHESMDKSLKARAQLAQVVLKPRDTTRRLKESRNRAQTSLIEAMSDEQRALYLQMRDLGVIKDVFAYVDGAESTATTSPVAQDGSSYEERVYANEAYEYDEDYTNSLIEQAEAA